MSGVGITQSIAPRPALAYQLHLLASDLAAYSAAHPTAVAGLLAATAGGSINGATFTPAGLLAAGITEIAAAPRRLRFTIGGAFPAQAAGSATVTGTGPAGALSEVVTFSLVAGFTDTVGVYSTITSIVFATGIGVLYTMAIGYVGVQQRVYVASGACPNDTRLDGWHTTALVYPTFTADIGTWVLAADIGIVGNSTAIVSPTGIGGQGAGVGDFGSISQGLGAPSLAYGSDLGGVVFAIRIYTYDSASGPAPLLAALATGDVYVEVLLSPRTPVAF